MSALMGGAILVTYYLVALGLLPTLLRVVFRLPSEVVRKVRHIGVSLSIFIFLEAFSTWSIALLALALLGAAIYPALRWIGGHSRIARLIADRPDEGSDLPRQMLYLFGTFALLIVVYWGVLGEANRSLAAAAVMAWGFGDAAAALVGKFFGTKHVVHRLIEGAKTWEGTGAMLVAAAVATFLTLHYYTGLSWYVSLGIALGVAPITAVAELFSRRGFDTVIVPLVAGAVILPVAFLNTPLGWA